MDSNTYSTGSPPPPEPPGPPEPPRPPGRHPDELAELAAVLDRLAARDLDRLPDAVRAHRVLILRRLADRLDGQWLKELAGVDARGAAGAEDGLEMGSTAGWLRTRLRLAAGTASTAVRTARALFRGPLTETAQALCAGDISAAHAGVVAHGTGDLPDHLRVAADPVVVDAARHLDPRQLRHVVGHLGQVADPDGADAAAQRRHARRGVWLTPTYDQLVAIDGLLEPEAGQTLRAALEPLARPADAGDQRSGSQRTADALCELARRSLEGGQLPVTGGVRPQLSVVVDLDSLRNHPGAVGGDLGGFGPLESAACRRLACDGAVTRVMVTRQPNGHHGRTSQADGQHPTNHRTGQDNRPGPAGNRHDRTCPTCDQHPGSQDQPGIDPSRAATQPDHSHPNQDPSGPGPPRTPDPCCTRQATDPCTPTPTAPLGDWLQDALTRLPRLLGGAPSQPLDVGRTSRTITPAQRHALAVRDGGCVFPGCSRPLVWCEGHHLVHWLDGGPTDLANLVLLCRAHHRAVHEGGWRLTRDPDGGVTATPPYRRHRTARRHPRVA